LQAKIDELDTKTDAASVRRHSLLKSLLCDQTQHADGTIYSLADRFRGVTCSGFDANREWDQLAAGGRRPNLQVFTAARPSTSYCRDSRRECRSNFDCPPGDPCEVREPVQDDVWPGALRITVDVFDRERRLERPLRHVMVVPIGG